MREIELLAPAKDLATGIEAIKHGADAVYIGASRFGARAAAGNSVDDIRQLVDFAHPYGVKVYVTLNTIIFDSELSDVQRLVEQLADVGVDALIVQDMALLNSKLKIKNSKLRLHASTQMDNRTAEKVAWLRDLGFRQVVLARELTLDEIRDIHERVPDVRLEVFVHGAICVSYNGQCYASQHLFKRSANRGECAQFCRMPFDLIEVRSDGAEEKVLMRQKHLLSLRDMNRSNELEALLDAGASSLKIEGRLKDVAYVKNVVAYYRQRLDEIFSRRKEYCRSSLGKETIAFSPNLAKSFNRLATNYFLNGRTRDMANIYTPKSMGEPVGEDTELHNGDGLCYINEEGQLEGFRVNRVEGKKIYLSNGNILPLTSCSSSLRKRFAITHLSLYRNYDHQFEQQLAKPTATRKVGVRWHLRDVEDGFVLRLIREDGVEVEQHFPYTHEVARSSQREQIERQLSRLGDTPYESVEVEVEMTDNWFIPGSVLADWRRKTVERMMDAKPQKEESEGPAPVANFSPLPFAISHIQYLGNVANKVARQFYLDHGATKVDWAMEVEHPKGEEHLLMTCRYCIRYELGMCNKLKMEDGKLNSGTLFLRLADGRRFRLHFDCKNCQMRVYSV